MDQQTLLICVVCFLVGMIVNEIIKHSGRYYGEILVDFSENPDGNVVLKIASPKVFVNKKYITLKVIKADLSGYNFSKKK